MTDEHLPGAETVSDGAVRGRVRDPPFAVDCTKSPTVGMYLGYLTL